MPQLGEITTRNKLGLRGGGKMIWAACPTCTKERWTLLAAHRERPRECQSCVGKRTQKIGCRAKKPNLAKRQRGAGNPSWSGGNWKHKAGYRYQWVAEDDPMRSMGGRDPYVFEHRLVVARAIGRPLKATEYVHHMNGNKADNRIENLEVWVQMHPSGVRYSDHHCPGCRCFES